MVVKLHAGRNTMIGTSLNDMIRVLRPGRLRPAIGMVFSGFTTYLTYQSPRCWKSEGSLNINFLMNLFSKQRISLNGFPNCFKYLNLKQIHLCNIKLDGFKVNSWNGSSADFVIHFIIHEKSDIHFEKLNEVLLCFHPNANGLETCQSVMNEAINAIN